MTFDDIRNTRTRTQHATHRRTRAARAHKLKFAAPLVAALGRPDKESSEGLGYSVDCNRNLVVYQDVLWFAAKIAYAVA
jgi:hypothetical protein